MPDPSEGVDPDGFITTGVARRNLRPPFLDAIRDAAEICDERCSAGYGLYVYGSVATGRAVDGLSDLDLLLVARSEEDVAAVADLAGTLTRRYEDTFREVSLATVTERELFADTLDGHANRCFVKHYCLGVAGRDLTADLPPCRPTPELAGAFAAETSETLERVSQALDREDGEPTGTLARAVARKLLLTCAAIVSAETGGWTTDRERATDELSRLHPERSRWLRQAAEWSDPGRDPDVQPEQLREFIQEFGGWVVERLHAAIRS